MKRLCITPACCKPGAIKFKSFINFTGLQQALSVARNYMADTLNLSDITIDELYDVAILSHGFMRHKRDYYFHLEAQWKEPFSGQYLLIFRHCYEMAYHSTTDSQTLIQSWDDCFIDMKAHEKAGEPDGYVWGTNWMLAYPGFSVVKESLRAAEWSRRLNTPMQEVQLEAEIFQFNFVFHNWTLRKINDKTDLIDRVLFPVDE